MNTRSPDSPMRFAESELLAWMALARGEADLALPTDVPVGALLLDRTGTIIGRGHNHRERDSDPVAHAEVVALRQAGRQQSRWRFDDCTMVVTLEPCPMCAAALYQAHIPHVVYGASDPLQGALGSKLHLGELYGQRMHITSGIDEEACRIQLQAFFQAKRGSEDDSETP